MAIPQCTTVYHKGLIYVDAALDGAAYLLVLWLINREVEVEKDCPLFVDDYHLPSVPKPQLHIIVEDNIALFAVDVESASDSTVTSRLIH